MTKADIGGVVGHDTAERLDPPLPEVVDLYDRRLARRATGLLRAANEAGVLHAADVHVATRVAHAGGERDERVLLAVALAVRAVREGSVCLDLGGAGPLGAASGLDWPSEDDWLGALRASPLLFGVLHLDGHLLYLDRYWREENQVVADLRARLDAVPPPPDPSRLGRALAASFPRSDDPEAPDYAEQRLAAEVACRQGTSIITGGPGTGKTTTIARLLDALLAAEDGPRRIALAAPSGKAAARMTQALQEAVERPDFPVQHRERLRTLTATTVHRLLGWRPDSRTRFRHDRGNPLPHDVVVIDETSMVSLTMMARLLEALRPQTRLVLVGDADQLASVDAGAVLKDLVEGLPSEPPLVARLATSQRYGGAIGSLAEAIRVGDVEATVTAFEVDGSVRLVPAGGADDAVRAGAVTLLEAARSGDPTAAVAALDEHRLLCAHREGDYGVRRWNRRVERWLMEHLGVAYLEHRYAGQPLLVTANDYGLELFNGDTGVVVESGRPDSRLVARITAGTSDRSRELPLARIADVETAHAMTVHRAQGSQFQRVTLVLPPDDSRLLTREMLYTAVTRAQTQVTVVGSVDAVVAAVRTPAVRASGLAHRFSGAAG